jgi:hypothetical protein
MDGHCVKIMHNVFFAYLHQLNQGHLKLPPGWLQVALNVKKTFYHMIRLNFIEFCYCLNNWKADFLVTQNYSQWYKYHITNGKKQANADSSSLQQEQKIEENPPEDTELEYTMDVDSPTSITSELPIKSTILVKPVTIPIKSSTLSIKFTIPVKPNVTPITPNIPTTVPDSVSLNNLIDPVLKMISNHNSIDPSDTVTETAATDPAIPKPAHVNIPEVPPASIVPQVSSTLLINWF